MKVCPYKCNYNDNRNFKNDSFICSNCLNKQLIKGNYVFTGYCTSTRDDYHNSAIGCNNFRDIDEISFVCSYQKCLKISFNNLNGEPKYNPVSLNNQENEILNILSNNNQSLLYDLIREYLLSLKLKHNSSATLLARKILMHFAFELGCKEEGKNFPLYVDYIKNDGILGKKWKSKLDKIRTIGNQENHEIKIASDLELQLIQLIMEQLINSYFLPDLAK